MIGQRVFVWDENRRVYRRDASGKAMGSPIWREHWRPAVICGETPRYWLAGHAIDSNVTLSRCLAKIPKKGDLPSNIALDEQHIERRAWIAEHRGHLANMIRTIECHDTLRKVAELIGYEATADAGGEG